MIVLNRRLYFIVFLSFFYFLLTACSNSTVLPKDRLPDTSSDKASVTPSNTSKKNDQDSAPREPIDLSHVKDAVPQEEVIARYGNHSPYHVLGKTYEVMDSNENVVQTGIASWYGTKFHGRLTSTREPYDMLKMTAAHKTLPLPSYVRVTNLDNQKQVVVKVNDRGPFVDERIIDLSYAAAHRIEMHNKGLARVKIEVLPPFLSKTKKQKNNIGKANKIVVLKEKNFPHGKNNYLQIGVFSKEETARKLQSSLVKDIPNNVLIIKDTNINKTLYKVRIGPITDYLSLTQVQEVLIARNLPHYYLISE